jgi:hypothetical protein
MQWRDGSDIPNLSALDAEICRLLRRRQRVRTDEDNVRSCRCPRTGRYSAPACCAVLRDMKRRVSPIVIVALLLVGAGTVAGWRWWHNRPPFGPEALNARATLRLVDQATADAALEPVNAEFANDDDDQIFLGRVTWDQPPTPPKDTSLRIVLLDTRRHLLPGFIAVTSANPEHVGTGLDGSLDIAQNRYPWLKGAGTQESNGSFMSSGSAVFVSSIDASPVTFQTVLHAARPGIPPEHMVATAPAAVQDLLVALICVGPEGQVYWAQRLLN